MVPRVGQRIGPYEILGRLGSGGMGLVFSAWDARLHRDVALKILRDEYSTPEMRARFLQEARAVSGMNHPNICTIFDIGEDQGDPYMVMELLKGRTLRSRILEGPLPFEDLLQVATEIAEALSAAHARGVIHRDIKPANIILVDKPGGRFVTKVLDFGLAKIDLGDGLNAALDYTNNGSTVGTVAYMSPEQARGEPLDARSDLFALGTVCYEMATGEVPFRGATSAMVFVQLLNHPPEAVRQINASVPKEFEKVLDKLLEKDRSQRYQSAAEAVAALEEVRLKAKPSRSFWRGLLGPNPPSGPSTRAEIREESLMDLTPPLPPRNRPGKVEGDVLLRPVRRVVSSDFGARVARTASGSAAAVSSGEEAVAGAGAAEGPKSAVPEMGFAQDADLAVVAGDSSGISENASSPGNGILQFQEPKAPREPPAAAEPPAVVEGAVESDENAEIRPLDLKASANEAAQEMEPGAAAEAANGEGNEEAPAPHVVWSGSSSERRAARAATDPRPSRSPFRVEELRDALEKNVDREPEQGWRPAPGGPLLLATIAALIVIVTGSILGWNLWQHHRVPPPLPPSTLVIAGITNNTGDDQLGSILLGGLELDLKPSRRVSLLGLNAMSSGLRALGVSYSPTGPVPSVGDARRGAQAVGAGMVLFGSAQLAGSSYILSAQVYNVATGAKVVDLTENAGSREQLLGAIDRLGAEIRTGLGESGDSVAQNSVPLSRNGTANLDALAAYAKGESLLDSGQFLDAMHALGAAAQADPHFVEPQLVLAELFRRQRAEVESAKVATAARDNSASTSARTRQLAQGAYDIYASGDLPRAEAELQALAKDYPNDEEVASELSLCLRLEGKFEESLALSQAILSSDPFAQDVASNAEYSLIAMDRTEAALQLESQIQRSGRSHPGLRLLMNLLVPHDDGPQGVELTGAMGRLAPQQYEAMTLDAGGMLDGGLQAWHAVAAQASVNAELLSAAGHTLAQAGLDRALVDECVTAKGLIADAQGYPQGPSTLFDEGLAAALCGDLALAQRNIRQLENDYRENWVVKSYELPDLQAVVLWKQHAPEARKLLEDAHGYDRISLTPYLRGLIAIEQQPKNAIIDFQGLLEHRGATTLANPVLFAMAQYGLARAYEASGDESNSAEAYAKFLKLWGAADPALTMLREARQHAK
ncbi:Serine/threonine protein kinase [Bryocella elongata]|uniref:Serine/threonine protein kinase n=1 Tax=Bryocella elongata TaxID=863522 RepID=A0A1H5U022_9BACT|nr:serine/threonine-protein kinase [Bryocella elongata]SEF67627.1 Serine/threonine protein kinase [Bryocella elongata]